METVTLAKVDGKIEIRTEGFDKFVKDWAKYFDGKWNGQFWTIDAKWEEKFCMKMRGDREVVYAGTEVETETEAVEASTEIKVGDIVIDKELTEILGQDVTYEVLSLGRDNRVTLRDLKTGEIIESAPAEMVEKYEGAKQ